MSGTRYLLDTNFVIYYLNGASFAVDFYRRVRNNSRQDMFSISVMTRLELFSSSAMRKDEEEIVAAFVNNIYVHPLAFEVEQYAVAFRRATRSKTPDAIIAASAIDLNATLVTCDKFLLSASFPGLRTIHPH